VRVRIFDWVSNGREGNGKEENEKGKKEELELDRVVVVELFLNGFRRIGGFTENRSGDK